MLIVSTEKKHVLLWKIYTNFPNENVLIRQKNEREEEEKNLYTAIAIIS